MPICKSVSRVQPHVKIDFNKKCKEIKYFCFGEMFDYILKFTNNIKKWPTENL